MRVTRTVGIIVGIAAVVAAGVWFQRSRGLDQPTAGAMRTAQVTRGTLTVSVTASGVLEPYAEVEVRSRSTGKVADLRVQEGDRVKKGQLLAVIDDSDSEAAHAVARSELLAAQANLTQARRQLNAATVANLAAIARAEEALRTARAKLAQTLAGSRQEEIDQQRAAVEAAQLSASLAKQNLDRNRELFTGGLVARQALDEAQNAADTAQAQVRAAQAKLTQLQTGSTAQEIAVARAGVREAESALAAARAARLEEAAAAAQIEASAAAVGSKQSSFTKALNQLNESRVTAPIDGIVSKLSVQVGQTVIGGSSAGGTLVLTIADTRLIQARINVDESDIAQINVGIPVRVTLDALPEETFHGRVLRIAPQSTVTNNVTQFDVIVAIDNPGRRMRLGMTADGEFIIAEHENVLLVPAEAVRGTKTKTVTVLQDGRLAEVSVETGATDGTRVEIVRGLEAGQTVSLDHATSAGSGTNTQQTTNPFMPQPPRGQPAGPPPR
jgi:HlyD family secretion protein